jgi:enediyne biosynthesis protein E4
MMTNIFFRIITSLLFIIVLYACAEPDDEIGTLFHLMSPEETGIDFLNEITSSQYRNIQNHPFLYNGGGVAVGDVSGNGLPDVYLTGNQVSSRLYLNKGDMQFEDVTKEAGVNTDRWASGVSMIDINGNGLLDIYVSVLGLADTPAEERANLLFINNGDGTFTESAAEFNLADTSFTTQAAFLDYNGSGYLDVYLLNNSEADFRQGAIFAEGDIRQGSSASFDKLYRNNGDGTFTDVSREAGLVEEIGYGLGVAVADLNRNGWPDIYISNDLQPNDVLYINNGDGTFTDKSGNWLKHTSLSGMGVDIADFNNNGWPDILQTDMMPEELNERKTMSGSVTYDQQQDLIERGSQYQYAINTLQLSNGVKQSGDLVFSEIGRQAGISYTDWTWASLFADFNNNGLKDALITNGFPKAVYDFDYKLAEFSILQQAGEDAVTQIFQLVEDLRSIEIPNYLYQNDGEIGFLDRTSDWGLDQKGYSYGAAYVDLNNNGRLDLVINNINAQASIYKNKGSREAENHYLKVLLAGEYPNTRGIGAEVILSAGGKKQYLYQSPYRGYQSSVDDRLHFGLGSVSQVDTLEIFWPDGRYQFYTDLTANQMIIAEQEHADTEKEIQPIINENPIFQQVSNQEAIQWTHSVDDSFVDFEIQPQIPYKHSRLGPVMAAGDLTGNGLDDVYLGGGIGIASKLFLQQENGEFVESGNQLWEADRDFKDTGVLFFDANDNGLLDIYVASGGFQVSTGSMQQDRLYINQGKGQFARVENALPEMLTSTKAVAAGDFTGDGLLDLFVGGRLTPFNYPIPPRSYLLRNDGGTFTDITEEAAPELLNRV